MGLDQLKKSPIQDVLYARLKQDGKPVGPNELFMRTIREHIQKGNPIPIVGLWGIGEKQELDGNDDRFLDSLEELQKDIEEVYQPGAQITVILADMHGVFNGEVLYRQGKERIRAGVVARYRRLFQNAHAPYLAKVAQALENKGIQTRWLSDLYKDHRLEIPNIHHPIDVHSEAHRILMEREQGRHESYIQSARHNRRGVEPIRAAYHYLRGRLQEKQMLVDAFPGHIFFVNGGRNLALRIVPEEEMPILYLREGPVWFQYEDMKGGERK